MDLFGAFGSFSFSNPLALGVLTVFRLDWTAAVLALLDLVEIVEIL